MKIKSNIAIAMVYLAAQSEAYNFGKLLGTTAHSMNGAGILVNTFLNHFKDPVVCPENHFKSKIMSTSALCQLVDDNDALDVCRSFGSSCVSVPGRWGCGYIETKLGKQRGCFFEPRRPPSGVKLPRVKFDNDKGDRMSDHYNDGFQCIFGRRTTSDFSSWFSPREEDSDTIDVDYHGMSDFYAKTSVSDMWRYYETWEENSDSGSKSPTQALTAIVKALDLAGIRYPVGKNTCNFCKNVCGKIMSGDNVNRCKYDACVKFLGGYRGKDNSPSLKISGSIRKCNGDVSELGSGSVKDDDDDDDDDDGAAAIDDDDNADDNGAEASGLKNGVRLAGHFMEDSAEESICPSFFV
ncbi:hypothetical protein FBU30_004433 [Linnemannia zychae]|nr:hypothetical protein FBU30_004433 [Linnemannia zychae]